MHWGVARLANSSSSLTVPWRTRAEVVAGCRSSSCGDQRADGRIEFASVAMPAMPGHRSRPGGFFRHPDCHYCHFGAAKPLRPFRPFYSFLAVEGMPASLLLVISHWLLVMDHSS
jgi:hypothetical protein